ncbi:hypothetical protein DF105_01195 [Burkholderia stagnalis]|uniref:hypothetical protein n=1 Tax=Burkholderia stagnalis TaxID=1503054 RepID=UPI000F5E83AD|nr:hypothetical protein [Burkholderia stagnalis]RQZ08945.1 hypothetical protein DF105_01195 [Burkholderia stagnalis]
MKTTDKSADALTAQEALAAIETFEIVGENNDSREPNADDRFILTEFIAHAFGGYPVEQHEAAPIGWQLIVQAINAVDKEAARRGEMYPQTDDEQRVDRKAVRRVIEMIEWYATEGGAVATEPPMPINEALTPEQIESAWETVKLSPWPLQSVELNQTTRHKFARAIEREVLSAAPQPVADDAAAQSDERARFDEARELLYGNLETIESAIALADATGNCSQARGLEAVEYQIRRYFSIHPTPQAGVGRAVMDDRIARLREAIEGECEGLNVDYHHARRILEYVDGDAAREGEKQ